MGSLTLKRAVENPRNAEESSISEKKNPAFTGEEREAEKEDSTRVSPRENRL